MKTTFTLNALVAMALPNVLNQERLIQACESYLNGFKPIASEATRGNVNCYKDGQTKVKETETVTYAGVTDVVGRFLMWHDRVVSLADRAEKLGCMVSITDIPKQFAEWLEKFVPLPEGKTKGNGKATVPATA